MQGDQPQHRLLRAGSGRHGRRRSSAVGASGRRRRRPAAAGNAVGHRPRQRRRSRHLRAPPGSSTPASTSRIPTSTSTRRAAGPSLAATRRPIDQNGHGTHVAGTIAALRQYDRRDRRCAGRAGRRGSRARPSRQRLELGRHRRRRLCRGQRPGRRRRQHEPRRRRQHRRSTRRWSMRPPAGSASRSPPATRATMPTTTRRRAPTARTSTPSRPSRSATCGPASRTSAIRRSILRSRACRSSRPG